VTSDAWMVVAGLAVIVAMFAIGMWLGNRQS
jgi:hypothetical protein